jgi:DoxX-like family
MSAPQHPERRSKTRIWFGRIVTAVPVLFMLFDATMHIAKPPSVVKGFPAAGFSLSLATPLGIVVLICLALYLYPRTSVLGAILLTGYLGGAVAANVRLGLPLFEYVLAPVYIGILFWGGLWLRDNRVRALIPLRS